RGGGRRQGRDDGEGRRGPGSPGESPGVYVRREWALPPPSDADDSGEVTMPTPLRATLPGLGDHLREIGAARDTEARAAAVEARARREEEAGASVPLVLRLISGDTNSMRFALEVAARLAAPLPGELLPPILDLLERPRLPSRLRIAVTAQVIRSVPAGSPVVPRLLDALGRKVSPSRAVNRLRRLAPLLPDSVPVAWALAHLGSGSANPCPRCGARLGPDDFVGHLWELHRLLTANVRVRQPLPP